MFGSNSDLSNIDATDTSSRPSSRTSNQRPQSARASYIATPKNERRAVEIPKIEKPGKLESGFSSTIQEESRIPKIRKIVKDVKTENEKAEASEAALQKKKP